MFATYLILLCVSGFCKSAVEDRALNPENRDTTTNIYIKNGCSASATATELIAAEKCLKAASGTSQYYEIAMKAVADGTCPTAPTSAEGKTDFEKFCGSIKSVDDQKTQTFMECIGKAEGSYPDPAIIAAAPGCKSSG